MGRSQRNEIESLIREFAERLEAAVRRAVAEQVREHAASLRSLPARGAKQAPTAAGARRCPVPGCGKPAAGPRNRWKCREHRDVVVASAAPRAVKIQRLPPGPKPGEKRRSGPPMECRMAGCTAKSRGPRFNFFCAEHVKLPLNEQRLQIEAWRANRAKKPFEGSLVIRKAAAEASAEGAASTEAAAPANAP